MPAAGVAGTPGNTGARSDSPDFINSYTGLPGSGGPQSAFGGRRRSLESPLPVSPQLTPQPSPPLNNCSPTSGLDKTPITPVSTYQVDIDKIHTRVLMKKNTHFLLAVSSMYEPSSFCLFVFYLVYIKRFCRLIFSITHSSLLLENSVKIRLSAAMETN